MGLFDRLKKQDCEICGKEVGMFGYKKLQDGEICKDCVKLLSPWFEDRRESTVAQIKEQLGEIYGCFVGAIINRPLGALMYQLSGRPRGWARRPVQASNRAKPGS